MQWLVVIVLALIGAGEARAHQTSIKFAHIGVLNDHDIEVEIVLGPSDVVEVMGLAADAKPTVNAAAENVLVPPFVQRWLVIEGCTVSKPRPNLYEHASALHIMWTATCENPRVITLDLTAFFALEKRHEMVVRYVAPHAETVNTVVRANEPRITLRAGHSTSLLAWVRTGMDHIYGGIDHVLFVIALLFVVMLVNSAPAGSAAKWEMRAFLPTLRSTALVITAFTIAHSITLIAAALGVISLPSQLVESIIALSIAYTAAEDVVRPDVRWRFWLTFAFGLVHGLGFASVLAELLPPTDVVVPLLCFNVGVELGQLSIVLVALPILFGISRIVGAPRYRRVVLPLLAAPIFLCGIVMLVERVFELSLLPM